jgi:hypothetical protein
MNIAPSPAPIFAPNDLIKTSAYPTPENHHQSVIKIGILEKKLNRRKAAIRIIQLMDLW